MVRRRLAVVGVVLVMGVSALSGCTAARNTLGTTTSQCYRALAVAEDAVHHRGHFAGVRLLSASQLDGLRRLRGVITARSKTPVHSVCVVGYNGAYRPDQVSRPAGRVPAGGTGHFAVVVVSTPQNELLATVLLQREPLRFRHLT